MATVAETGLAVAAAVTVAMAVQTTTETAGTGNNQQNAAGSSRSGGDSGYGSSDHCNVAAMAGRGGGVAEVTTMRAAATAKKYPRLPLAMVRDDEREGRFVDQRW
jgi:hypothetical protein